MDIIEHQGGTDQNKTSIGGSEERQEHGEESEKPEGWRGQGETD